MRRFRFLKDPPASLAASDPVDFLRGLGGPSCLFFTGRDPSRTRALVTLLHGNEPSGVMALRRWLESGAVPAVNLLVVVASVHAALAEPCFTRRMLPRARDLNRCFRPPFDDEQGRLAEEILEVLRLHNVEAVVDMHNTSGSGPAFGVCTHADRQHDALTGLFAGRQLISHHRLGALMEISDARCPTVTVEVGGRLDAAAHDCAFDGLQRFALAPSVLASEDGSLCALEVLWYPMRLELKDGVTLAYGDALCPGHDVTLRTDIEYLNFAVVDRGTPLGWVTSDLAELFRAVDAQGRCAVSALLRREGEVLYPARALKLFMITGNAAIAQSDCVFYAVDEHGDPISLFMDVALSD